MAIFKQFIYTNTGTEIDFAQGLIDLICGLNDSITCEDVDGNPTTAAEQYADLTRELKPTFVFNFGGGLKVKLVRDEEGTASSTHASRRFSVVTNNDWRFHLQFLNALALADYATTRSLFIAYLKSDDFVALWIGAYNVTALTSSSTISAIYENDDCYVGVGNFNVLNSTFIGSNSSVTFSPAFSYSASAGKIDFAEQSTFVSGTAKQFSTEAIKSCSTMPQFSSIALPDGRNFFTISANAMVEVEEEE